MSERETGEDRVDAVANGRLGGHMDAVASEGFGGIHAVARGLGTHITLAGAEQV